MFNPFVSIIIRTKNESNWILSCIDSVLNQNYKKYEIIIVDNNSSDNTLKKIKKYNFKIIKIKKFMPGKALNLGIKQAKGSIIVCLSAHCIPTNEKWLGNLIKGLNKKNIAGIYGRQEPLSFSSPLDKRDLLTIFGKDKKIQIKDSFFHNANSAIKKSILNKIPFREDIAHIEDRYWAEEVIKKNYRLIYEPKASVFHWHGVNHDLNYKRASEIVDLLENIDNLKNKSHFRSLNNLKILAIIPKKGKTSLYKDKPLISYTIECCKKSKFIRDIIVTTDNKITGKISKSLGAKVPFYRPKILSKNFTEISEVLQFTYEKIEELKLKYDLVVILEETYPFRKPYIIDRMLKSFLKANCGTLIASKLEERTILKKNNNSQSYQTVNNEAFMPRSLKKNKNYISLFGLCTITYPENIKSKKLSSNIKLYNINDDKMTLEIR